MESLPATLKERAVKKNSNVAARASSESTCKGMIQVRIVDSTRIADAMRSLTREINETVRRLEKAKAVTQETMRLEISV